MSNVKEGLDSLAKSIATEQFVKKMSLEDFTNTITAGRSIFIQMVLNLGISNEEKTYLIHQINDLLDQFIHLSSNSLLPFTRKIIRRTILFHKPNT